MQQNIPLRVVAATFQKEPQVLMSQPGQGLDKFEDLKNAEQYIISDEGAQTYLLWLAADYGFDVAKRVPYTFNPAPFIANPKSIQQGYVTSEPLAVEKEGEASSRTCSCSPTTASAPMRRRSRPCRTRSTRSRRW